LAVSLGSGYKGQCCQQEGKGVKRPKLLQHPTAWDTWHRSPDSESLGKAPGREQPFIAMFVQRTPLQ